MSEQAVCCHCHGVLAKAPSRKTKCPHCGQYIYVRTDPQTRAKMLLTEHQAVIHDWIKRLSEEFGISRDAYERARSKNPSLTDVKTILALLEARAKHPRKDGFDSPAYTYGAMASLLYETGGDPAEYLKSSARGRLLELKEAGIETAEILAGDDGCPACLAMNHRTFSVEEALRDMPLPNRDCTKHLENENHSICRCIWTMGGDH
jgi:hypothetical protein